MTNKTDSNSITRRSFLAGALRLGALAGLVGGAGWLVGRHGAAARSGRATSPCINTDIPCRRCSIFQRCKLPRAEALKQK